MVSSRQVAANPPCSRPGPPRCSGRGRKDATRPGGATENCRPSPTGLSSPQPKQSPSTRQTVVAEPTPPYPGPVRVVGGDAGGRRLHAPAGRRTRPTSDQVREAVFNMLANLGGVEGKVVIDLFAGTGALGIEALSRGARSATFVEQDPRTVAVLRRNLEVIADRRATVEVATAD